MVCVWYNLASGTHQNNQATHHGEGFRRFYSKDLSIFYLFVTLGIELWTLFRLLIIYKYLNQPWARAMGRVFHGASCPWGELSVRRTVHGVNCPWGALSVGRTVRGANCPWGEMSMGRTVRGASCRGASCPGTGGPRDQWNCVWMQWDCRLSTLYIMQSQVSHPSTSSLSRCAVAPFSMCVVSV